VEAGAILNDSESWSNSERQWETGAILKNSESWSHPEQHQKLEPS
jgi:hypothetical protein